MTQTIYRRVIFTVLLTGVFGGSTRFAVGQTIKAPLDRGFARSSSISLSVEEMLGSKIPRSESEAVFGPGYPALWIGEIQYRPMRMLRLNVTDRSSGQSSQEVVWYLVYRMIVRDCTELAGDEKDDLRRQLSDETVHAQNSIDPVKATPLVMPKFILEVTDHDSGERYVDEPNPEVQAAILRREFRDAAGMTVFNSIDGIREVPEAVSVDDPEVLKKAVYGVAVWRNVDPETDFFKVEMFGFTNAYKISQDESGPVVEEKCFVQWFGRPGDRFEQNEREFRFDDEDHLPGWIYKERETPVEIDAPTLSVLKQGAADRVTE